MVFCKHCGNELPSQDADVCTHCGKLIKEIPSPTAGRHKGGVCEYCSYSATNQDDLNNHYLSLHKIKRDSPTAGPSSAWYLLPIFFGIIGGLIMFFVIKDENRDMAKKGIIVGAILTVVGFIIYGIIYGIMLASLSSLY